MRSEVAYWPLSSVALTQQFGSDRSNSGHAVNMAATLMTQLRHWLAAQPCSRGPLLLC